MTKASVILCTHNRADSLRRSLDALSSQTLAPGDLQVVVVDDASTDATPAVCAQMSSRVPGFTLVRLERNAGHAAAANRGLERASGRHILFTDDDCFPRADWAERMCEALDREPIVAGGIESPERPYLKLCHNVAQFGEFALGRAPGPTDFVAGANMGLRRDLLDALGGYDPGRQVAFDTELVLRAREKGFHPWFDPDAVVVHDPPERTGLPRLVRYAVQHAEATILLRVRHAALLRTPVLLRSSLLLLAAAPAIAFASTWRAYARNPRLRRQPATAPVVFLLKLAWCWGAAKGLRQRGG